ncbi:MAG: hypothetical protein PUB89_03610 [Oscillospiraceae bacterium]|nr:hypothetical protein [Oscillospiraceae bacterium]
MSKIDSDKILDISTPEAAAKYLQTLFTRNVAVAHKEVLIYGDIPPEAILTKPK